MVGGPNALLTCIPNPCLNDYFKEDLLIYLMIHHALEKNVVKVGGGPNAILTCLLDPCPNDCSKEDWLVSNCHVSDQNVTMMQGASKPNAPLKCILNCILMIISKRIGESE